jgi:short-subunit dehydrogenase
MLSVRNLRLPGRLFAECAAAERPRGRAWIFKRLVFRGLAFARAEWHEASKVPGMNSLPPIDTVLITGASSGIGYELACEFARKGHNLVIVAPVEPELIDIARRLRAEYGVAVAHYAVDLRNETAAADLYATTVSNGITVDILVNNAGLGRRGKFWEISLQDDISMLRLNIEACVRLTKHFLPAMLERRRGRILNTASIAGFEPGPMLAVYHATKAFVLSWSEALATEMKGTGVTLTALCP